MLCISYGPVIPEICNRFLEEGVEATPEELQKYFGETVRFAGMEIFGPDAILYEDDLQQKSSSGPNRDLKL